MVSLLKTCVAERNQSHWVAHGTHSRASENDLNSDKPKKSVGDLSIDELKGKRYEPRAHALVCVAIMSHHTLKENRRSCGFCYAMSEAVGTC